MLARKCDSCASEDNAARLRSASGDDIAHGAARLADFTFVQVKQHVMRAAATPIDAARRRGCKGMQWVAGARAKRARRAARKAGKPRVVAGRAGVRALLGVRANRGERWRGARAGSGACVGRNRSAWKGERASRSTFSTTMCAHVPGKAY